jgi:ferrous iron transport protein B
MANRTFRLMGLNGKAVLPMVLGLGCGTMATLTARIMDSRKSQLIVIILLALGVPCSAQLGVVLGMLGNIGGWAVIAVFAIVGLQMLVVGTLANRVLPGGRDDFIIEIPLVRLPQLSNVAVKTVQRVEWFLREAVPYFLLGTFILFALSRLGALVWIEDVAKPVVSGLLGLPPEAARAFLIGFLRRDYGAAGLFDMRLRGKLDGLQTVVAMVTITLFVPCIASFFIMVKERGLKTAAAIVAFIFPVAVLTGAVVNIVFRALGLSQVFGP